MPVKNFNTTIAKTFHDRMNMRDGVFLDNELSQNKPIPVIEIDKPIINITKSAVNTDASSATIYTTPTDKDFYLTSVFLAVQKDANATNTNTNITATIDGVSGTIIAIPQLTLTAQNMNATISFPFPIKIDRGTIIAIGHATTTSSITGRGCISGFISDTLRY